MDALWRPLKRARASISGPVQTTDKENTAAAVPATQGHAPDRRKRAQSLGGPLHSQLHKEELSPRKKARRSLVRAILRPNKINVQMVNKPGPILRYLDAAFSKPLLAPSNPLVLSLHLMKPKRPPFPKLRSSSAAKKLWRRLPVLNRAKTAARAWPGVSAFATE